MWKLLRNLVLAAVLVAGTLKLLAGYSVSKQAQRLVAALAPYAQIKYEGITAGLDGSVSLTKVDVVPGFSRHVYRADSVVLHSPGLLWLLDHALRHKDSPPEHLIVDLQGLTLPAEPWLNPHWWDTRRFVLFASAGCPNEPSALDFQRMSGDASPPHERLEYSYDPEQRSLDTTLTLAAPGMATLELAAHSSRFEPATIGTSAFWSKLHLDRFSVDYADHGFFRNRNRYCAERAGLAPEQFIDRHLGVVRSWLQNAGVQPSEEVLAMYRELAAHGGEAKLLSLPGAGFAFDTWRNDSPQELLRRLNVTVRYRQQPPIMFRLAFAPEANSAPASATDVAAIAVGGGTATKGSDQAAAAADAPAGVSPPPSSTVPPHATPAQAIIRPAPIVVVAPTPRVSPPQAVEPVEMKPAIPPRHHPDHAAAKVTAVATPGSAPLSPPKAVAGASAPPPLPGSTLALVWKPGVIEDLPETAPMKKDYEVVDFGRLEQLSGHRVRLLTEGGKRIEGQVVSANAHEVVLRVERGGGNAQFTLARDRIEQVQLIRH